MKIPLTAKMTLAAVLLLSAGAAAAEAPMAVMVMKAWVAEAPPTARNNAAYLTLKNGPRQDTLLGVRTPVAEVAEIHEMRMEGGLMRMQQLATLELAPHEELKFGPGGRHIMLINMKRPLKTGERVPLTLKFRHAGEVLVQAEVQPLQVDDDPHRHHRH